MAKRFTDTNKYKDPFIRGLQGAYKLLWDYLYHDCDHSGIWIVDFEIAQVYLGSDMVVNKSDAIKFFNKDKVRVIEIDGGKKWFIPKFVEFQYGELNEKNRVHASVLTELKKYGVKIKPLTSPLQGAKDKDKDKEEDILTDFDKFWDAYHLITQRPKEEKESALKYWKGLNATERLLAVEMIQSYYDSVSDKKYIKKARTYLSGKSFNNEFKTSTNPWGNMKF